jgi:metallo-beta-lactamase family protein
MATRLIFRGAAGTVTGSCTLLEHAGHTIAVDCGMFQGNRSTRALNFEPFPFEPSRIDCVLLTHAHIDHSGLLPKLTRNGFRGAVHATAPTIDLLGAMLPDSAAIQENDVAGLNRRRRRRGEPAVEPIYTVRDAEEALRRMRPHVLEQWLAPAPGLRARFWNAGHMLGSASIELMCEGGGGPPLRLLFSGDLGPEHKVFHLEPDAPEGFDHVVCESTYGDRDRPPMTLAARRTRLGEEIRDAFERGGNLVIPCFAVERSQELLHDIGVLLDTGAIPNATVFLDSPLASRITEVFALHEAAMPDVALEPGRLFRNPAFRITESVEDSQAINRVTSGAIIISASGMAEAGRIKHHLRANLWRREATVLFVGYQAPGTLGAILQGGAERVRIHDREIEVRAQIRSLEGYSAHADQGELIEWLLARRPVRGAVFLNHGEEGARATLRDLLAAAGFDPARIHLPFLDDAYNLLSGGAVAAPTGKRRVEPEALQHDWQDAHAAFDLGLGRRLADLPDDRARVALLRRLEAALRAGQEPPSPRGSSR